MISPGRKGHGTQTSGKVERQHDCRLLLEHRDVPQADYKRKCGRKRVEGKRKQHYRPL